MRLLTLLLWLLPWDCSFFCSKPGQIWATASPHPRFAKKMLLACMPCSSMVNLMVHRVPSLASITVVKYFLKLLHKKCLASAVPAILHLHGLNCLFNCWHGWEVTSCIKFFRQVFFNWKYTFSWRDISGPFWVGSFRIDIVSSYCAQSPGSAIGFAHRLGICCHNAGTSEALRAGAVQCWKVSGQILSCIWFY